MAELKPVTTGRSDISSSDVESQITARKEQRQHVPGLETIDEVIRI